MPYSYHPCHPPSASTILSTLYTCFSSPNTHKVTRHPPVTRPSANVLRDAWPLPAASSIHNPGGAAAASLRCGHETSSSSIIHPRLSPTGAAPPPCGPPACAVLPMCAAPPLSLIYPLTCLHHLPVPFTPSLSPLTSPHCSFTPLRISTPYLYPLPTSIPYLPLSIYLAPLPASNPLTPPNVLTPLSPPCTGSHPLPVSLFSCLHP